MSNEVLLETLHQISEASQRMLKRFELVKSADDFLDAEAIFDICENNVEPLSNTTNKMIKDLKKA